MVAYVPTSMAWLREASKGPLLSQVLLEVQEPGIPGEGPGPLGSGGTQGSQDSCCLPTSKGVFHYLNSWNSYTSMDT